MTISLINIENRIGTPQGALLARVFPVQTHLRKLTVVKP
jgi:hypothetical protein